MMNKAVWFLLTGSLMLAIGLLTPLIRRLPITSAIIYLAVGFFVGPTVLGLFHFNPLSQSALLEVLTEVVILISLFSAGVKMPAPVTFSHWRAPLFLATFSMTASVALVAAFAHYLLGLSLGAAVLIGAILAPTDPVLATDVQIRHPADHDRFRFTLTCEAGMNDGSAFPFVMLGLGLLGLHDLGEAGIRWAIVDFLWATVAGVGVGILSGWSLAHASARMQLKLTKPKLLNDFLGLGLIGCVYGLSLLLHTWGFLAVFFAAVALRHTELKIACATPECEAGSGSMHTVKDQEARPHSRISEASLIFKEHLERLSELLLILLLGGMLFADSWSWRATFLALFVFIIARPLSVVVGLIGTRTSWRLKGLVGWFGVRGIGSLYYLMYAIQHGIPESLAVELIHLTLIVVTLSILVHGISMKPMMRRIWHRSGTSTKRDGSESAYSSSI